jgi:hypothetical protein
MLQNIKSLFQKASVFNSRHVYSSAFVTTFVLGASIYCLHQVIDDFEKKKSLVKSLISQHESSKKLLNAQKKLKNSQQDAQSYLQQSVETVSLLADVRHRYENSCYPKVPVDLSPISNAIVHTFSQSSGKGLQKTLAVTQKPFLADEEDLKHLFSLIEGEAIFPYKPASNSPYFYFRKFHMKKQTLSTLEKCFEVSYTLEHIQL